MVGVPRTAPRVRTVFLAFAAVLATAAAAAPALASNAGATLLVSRPDGLAPPPPALDNASSTPVVSADGRFLAFTSVADGIAPGVDPRVSSVVVRDTQTNTTTLASRSDGVDGAPANTGARALAVGVEPGSVAIDPPADQPHVLVVFSTTATNVVDHPTGATVGSGAVQVWMRDVTAGTTRLVSRLDGPAGAAGDGNSEQAALVVGPAGPLVALRSHAKNLPGGAVPGQVRTGIFLREVNQGATTYVSCRVNCTAPTTSFSSDPSIAISTASFAHNGFCQMNTDQKCLEIAFATDDASVTGDPGGHEQVVVATSVLGANGRPTTFGYTTMSAVPALGGGTTFGNDLSRRPSLSGDGLAVGYISRATNLLFGGDNVRDHGILEFSNGFIDFAARAQNGEDANSDIDSISVGGTVADGIKFVFATSSTNLGVDQPDNPFLLDHAYVASTDPQTGNIGPAKLIDRAADGTSGDNQVNSDPGPQISADGSTEAFDSRATNLGGGRDFERIYTVAGATGAPTVVSRPTGTGPFATGVVDATIAARNNNMIGLRVVSANGRYVAFTSSTDDLAPGENNAVVGVFVRDLRAGTTTLVSRATGAGGVAADQDSQLNAISDDGRRVMFTTNATNLEDPHPVDHVYVRDLDTNVTTTVSRQAGLAGTIVDGDGIGLSGDGDSALFDARLPLVPDADNGLHQPHLYIHKLSTGSTTLVDRDTGPTGTVADAEPDDAAIDRDGNRVVWSTSAVMSMSPFPPRELVYMRDLAANTTTLVSRASGATGALPNAPVGTPVISGNGDVAAFASAATNLGTLVTSKQLWVRQLSGDLTTQLASRATGADGAVPNDISFSPVLDDAGDKLAFVSIGHNLGAPQVFPGDYGYVRDLTAQTTDVLNRADTTGEPADLPGSTSVSLSASGNCAAFSSGGSNLGDGFPSSDFSAVRLRVISGTCDADAQIAPPDTTTVRSPPVTTEPGTTPPPARAVVSHLRLVPSHFHVRGRHRGTTISFSLNRAVRVTLRFERLRSGRRHGGRCVAGAPHGRRCSAVHAAGSLTASARKGTNRIRFLGTLAHRALTNGSYRLSVTPVGGRTVSARFTVR